ncbi:hypothetical protein EVAR_98252_1 [Eumeta japonica]|uniref:Uncharacterized protein n=1 Tax=Eumeta variegata TaxID=151549 RepID=A0A4C1Y0Y8_EUMVA|nr:hypothetical protein EVAR_98252_1 [Eumeta japonica]
MTCPGARAGGRRPFMDNYRGLTWRYLKLDFPVIAKLSFLLRKSGPKLDPSCNETVYDYVTQGNSIALYRNTGSPVLQPDLAPCDFYLFRKMKEKLGGKWFTDAEEAGAAYKKAVEATPKCEWAKCFSHWFH